MSSTHAALKGTFGGTEYFVLVMKAGDLVRYTKFRSDKEEKDLKDMPLEERDQRDISFSRIEKHIVPYLTENKDSRFFGAVIIAVENFHPDKFEPFDKIIHGTDMPELYKTEAMQMGFLTLMGGEVFRPIDGQHRIKAIDFALSGKNDKKNDIKGITPDSSVADEEMTVILIEYDLERVRKVFTKVNRYAKPTTASQNLVIDDDDTIAVLSRIVANDVNIISPNLVNYKTSTLPDGSSYFTTLKTIADCNEAIIDTFFGGGKNVPPNLQDENRSLFAQYEHKIIEVWKFLVENINHFSDALADKESTGDKNRIEMRKDFLLGKPAVQLYLVSAFVRLVQSNIMSEKKAAEQLNKINWKIKDKLWDVLLIIEGRKIDTKNRELVTDVIYYMAGGKIDEAKLEQRYKELFHETERDNKKLPPRV